MDDQLLIDRLVEKSQEAFLLGLEIINKPTITYRAENFSFMICNAWELLLKAQLVKTKGQDSIYYKGNRDRTLSLTNCVDGIFTDFKNPVKANLNVIIKLRNEYTHFITAEYDNLFSSFFQANILFYIDHLKNTFNIDINNSLPNNFIAIATNVEDLDDVKVLTQLDKATFDYFRKIKKDLLLDAETDGVRIGVEVRLKNVKKGEDFTYRFDKDSDITGQVIREIQDPSNTHPYRAKEIVALVNERLNDSTIRFNSHSFVCVRYHENIEGSLDFFYQHKVSGTKTYSERVVSLIVKGIKETPNYLEQAKNSYNSRK